MRHATLPRALLLALILNAWNPADAADIGRPRMLSGVGQPLRIEIPIANVESTGGSRPSARVQAAESVDAALSSTAALSVSLSLQPRRDGRGGYIAVITSRGRVQQPVVDLKLELHDDAGQHDRRMVLLLPPGLRDTVSPVSLALSAESETIVVQRGDTLGEIAQRLRNRDPEYRRATLYQVLAALLQANPAAFIDGNMNRVRAGARLPVPDVASVHAIDAAEARRLYALHMEQFAAYRARLAKGAAPISRMSSRSVASGPIAAAEPSPPLPTGRDALRLSSAAPVVGMNDANDNDALAAAQAELDRLRDEQVASQRALADAQSRVSELESTLAQMQRLLQMQNEALARLQQTAPASGSGSAPAVAGDGAATGASAGSAEANTSEHLTATDRSIVSSQHNERSGSREVARPEPTQRAEEASSSADQSVATSAGRSDPVGALSDTAADATGPGSTFAPERAVGAAPAGSENVQALSESPAAELSGPAGTQQSQTTVDSTTAIAGQNAQAFASGEQQDAATGRQPDQSPAAAGSLAPRPTSPNRGVTSELAAKDAPQIGSGPDDAASAAEPGAQASGAAQRGTSSARSASESIVAQSSTNAPAANDVSRSESVVPSGGTGQAGLSAQSAGTDASGAGASNASSAAERSALAGSPSGTSSVPAQPNGDARESAPAEQPSATTTAASGEPSKAAGQRASQPDAIQPHNVESNGASESAARSASTTAAADETPGAAAETASPAASPVAASSGSAESDMEHASWLETYFWPLIIVIVLFVALVVFNVFRKRPGAGKPLPPLPVDFDLDLEPGEGAKANKATSDTVSDTTREGKAGTTQPNS